MDIRVTPWKAEAQSTIVESESSPTYLDRSLLVVFSIQNLFATHCADAFFVGTTLTVMRTWLVYRTFTNSASGELIFSIWIKPCFFRSQSFIFVQLPSATFCGVPGPVLPCVWSDNPAEFLFTLFTHHPSTGRPVPLNPQSRSSCQNTSTTQLRRLPLPVTSARFRTQPSVSGLSRIEKVAGGINASSWAGLLLLVLFSSSTIGYPVCACAGGHGSLSHLRVGGGGVPFPSAGGRVR